MQLHFLLCCSLWVFLLEGESILFCMYSKKNDSTCHYLTLSLSFAKHNNTDPTTSLHQLLPPILLPTHLSVVTTSPLELLQVSSTDVDLSLHRLVYLPLVLYKIHLDGVLFGISSWDVLPPVLVLWVRRSKRNCSLPLSMML